MYVYVFSTTVFANNQFADVNTDDWYFNQVTSVAEKEYMNGVGENRFSPNTPMTRAMFAQLLANFTQEYDSTKYTNIQVFSDVKSDAWYASAVNWAAEQKIVTGASNLKFNPENSITRQEMAVMIYNYAKAIGVDVTYATRAQIATVIINAEDILKSNNQENKEEGEKDMQILVKSNGNTIVFKLNDSQAAKDLYAQLPLKIQVQNYSNNEKIFYPPETLDTENAIEASGNIGSLAYYEPWGNVVMFYKSFSPSPGGRLYELGKAISGSEHIQNLTGTIEISKE